MPFDLFIKKDDQFYHIQAELIHSSDQIENYKVMGGDRYVILQNNQPLLTAKGLKHRKPDWKLIEGDASNVSMLNKTIEALNDAIKKQNNGGTYIHPKNAK